LVNVFLEVLWKKWHFCLLAESSMELNVNCIRLVNWHYNNNSTSKKIKVKKHTAVCATSTAPLQVLACYMRSHSVTCHPAEVTFPPLPKPLIRFSDPRGMQGWIDLVGLVTYRGGIPTRRRSPIPVLTGLNVEQLRSCDKRCYHSTKSPSVYKAWKESWTQCTTVCYAPRPMIGGH